MTVGQVVRARDRILASVAGELPELELLQEVVGALHEVALFDVCALIRTDPETMLPSASAVEGYSPDDCAPFWDNELLDPDFAKFNDLARSHDPVATLYDETGGDLSRSPRYQKIFSALGADDELRVAFNSGTMCWAVGSLGRPAGTGPFTPEEVAAVRELAPVATRALRHTAWRIDGDTTAAGPTMLVVDPGGRIESMTPDAEEVLFELRAHGLAVGDPRAVPIAVLTAARRAATDRTGRRTRMQAKGASGRWFKINASPLGDGGLVAVMIEPARRTELVPILLESYGLTERETEVVFLLARGLATKEIAVEMCISAHTVSDHIKVIFAKTGATSRGELIARLFSDHVFENYERSGSHAPSTTA